VLLAAAFWLVVRRSPREHPWCNQAERVLLDPASPPDTAPSKAPVKLWQRSTFLSLAMMLVYAFTSTFQDQLYVNWIPLFLTEGRGLSDAEMGLFTPLPLLARRGRHLRRHAQRLRDPQDGQPPLGCAAALRFTGKMGGRAS